MPTYSNRIAACIFAAASVLGVDEARAQSPFLANPVTPGFCFETFSNPFFDILYMNGIAARREEGRRGLRLVASIVRPLYQPYVTVCEEEDTPRDQRAFTFELQCNPTHGRLEDAVETLGLIRNAGLVRGFRAYNAAFSARPDLLEMMGEETLGDEELNAAAAQLQAIVGDAALLDALAERYERSLDADIFGFNRCPVVAAYSQGNLVVNRAFGRLRQRRDTGCLTIVGVASPDSLIEGDASSYVTSEEDVIISSLRTLVENDGDPLTVPPLPPNVSNGVRNEDRTGHALGDIYLAADAPSRAFVERAFDNAVFCNLDGALGEAFPGECPVRLP